MGKPEKDFKEEFDREFNNGTYVARKTGVAVLVTALIIILLGGIVTVGYTLTIGRAQKKAERAVFKESITYTEQAASFLAQSYKEYSEAEYDDDKDIIMDYVIIQYPNLDIDSIDNDTLKQFYIKCLKN